MGSAGSKNSDEALVVVFPAVYICPESTRILSGNPAVNLEYSLGFEGRRFRTQAGPMDVSALNAIDKRVIIFTGNYGSGKTEVSVNFTLGLSEQISPLSIVDLDIVNPYFRCREAREEMESRGIEVVYPQGEYHAAVQQKGFPMVGIVSKPDTQQKLEMLSTDAQYDLACACGDRLPGITLVRPEGTYLAWLDCRGLGLDDAELGRLMMDEARIYLDKLVTDYPGGKYFDDAQEALSEAGGSLTLDVGM